MRPERSPLESSSNVTSSHHQNNRIKSRKEPKGKGKEKLKSAKKQNNVNPEATCKSDTNHELTEISEIARIHQHKQN